MTNTGFASLTPPPPKETGYDFVQSDERLILSEAIFRSAKEDIDEAILQIFTGIVVLLCGLNSAF